MISPISHHHHHLELKKEEKSNLLSDGDRLTLVNLKQDEVNDLSMLGGIQHRPGYMTTATSSSSNDKQLCICQTSSNCYCSASTSNQFKIIDAESKMKSHLERPSVIASIEASMNTYAYDYVQTDPMAESTVDQLSEMIGKRIKKKQQQQQYQHQKSEPEVYLGQAIQPIQGTYPSKVYQMPGSFVNHSAIIHPHSQSQFTISSQHQQQEKSEEINDEEEEKNVIIEEDNVDNDADADEEEDDDDNDADDDDRDSSKNGSSKTGVDGEEEKYWTVEEDVLLLRLFERKGSDWAGMCQYLTRWSRAQIKIRFKSLRRANKRTWKCHEDEVILRELGELSVGTIEKLKAFLPGRTKHAIKTRFKYLRGLADGSICLKASTSYPLGSPYQAIQEFDNIFNKSAPSFNSVIDEANLDRIRTVSCIAPTSRKRTRRFDAKSELIYNKKPLPSSKMNRRSSTKQVKDTEKAPVQKYKEISVCNDNTHASASSEEESTPLIHQINLTNALPGQKPQIFVPMSVPPVMQIPQQIYDHQRSNPWNHRGQHGVAQYIPINMNAIPSICYNNPSFMSYQVSAYPGVAPQAYQNMPAFVYPQVDPRSRS